MWSAEQEEKNFSRYLETLGHVLESAVPVYFLHDPARPITYSWLHSIAQLRFALALCADVLSTYVADSPEKLQLTPQGSRMVEELVYSLSCYLPNENLQELSMYLAKHLSRRHGMKTLRSLYNQGYGFVLPVALHQQVRCSKRTLLFPTIEALISPISILCRIWKESGF